VRIALDAAELKAHPLQVGLSMQAEVDTHDRNGERLPQVAHVRSNADASAVYTTIDQLADERVHTIIAGNTNGRATAVQ